MRDFVQTKEIAKGFSKLHTNWTVARNGESDQMRMLVLHKYRLFNESYEDSISRIMSEELIAICDKMENLQIFFDAWLHHICRLNLDLEIPEQWEGDKFEALSSDLQEAWCNALEVVQGIAISLSYKIKELIDMYGLQLNTTLPIHLQAAFKTPSESTITGEVEQLHTDKVKDRDNLVLKGMESQELRRIFHDNSKELENFLIHCLYTKSDSKKKRKANELVKGGVIFKEDANKSLYDELIKIDMIKCKEVTWRGV